MPPSRPSPTRRAPAPPIRSARSRSLTQADAALDRLLASVAEEREAAERLSRAFDQALFAAQSRVRAVSDFIDVRRGSIGSEARTRLAEAVRQLQAAQDKRDSNLTEAIAHANGAAMLASQAQSIANSDAQQAQRSYAGRYGGTSSSNMGAVLGGIILGNILSGGDGRRPGGSMGRRLELDVLRRVGLVERRRRPLLTAPLSCP